MERYYLDVYDSILHTNTNNVGTIERTHAYSTYHTYGVEYGEAYGFCNKATDLVYRKTQELEWNENKEIWT